LIFQFGYFSKKTECFCNFFSHPPSLHTMLTQYQQVINQHRRRVFSFAYYSLRVKADAEDVTQEVFIKLWQNWQKIDHQKVGGWLMRVAHNAVIDHVRRQKPSDDGVDSYAEVEQQASESVEGAELDQEVYRLKLMEAIQSLEEPFKSIVIMRDIQGASYMDIRESLDVSESQVKVYLHRARRKLRENTTLRDLFNSSVSGAAEPGYVHGTAN
jgi:RNA polymerase sigma factor (sigma-70 family)